MINRAPNQPSPVPIIIYDLYVTLAYTSTNERRKSHILSRQRCLSLGWTWNIYPPFAYNNGRSSISTLSDDIKIHLSWISGLDFIMYTLQLPPEPFLWCCIQHLCTNTWDWRRPESHMYNVIRERDRERPSSCNNNQDYVIYLYKLFICVREMETMQWRRSCSFGSSQKSHNRSHKLHIGNHSQAEMQWNLRNSQLGRRFFRPRLPFSSRRFWISHSGALSFVAIRRTWSCCDQQHPFLMMHLSVITNMVSISWSILWHLWSLKKLCS